MRPPWAIWRPINPGAGAAVVADALALVLDRDGDLAHIAA